MIAGGVVLLPAAGAFSSLLARRASAYEVCGKRADEAMAMDAPVGCGLECMNVNFDPSA